MNWISAIHKASVPNCVYSWVSGDAVGGPQGMTVLVRSVPTSMRMKCSSRMIRAIVAPNPIGMGVSAGRVSWTGVSGLTDMNKGDQLARRELLKQPGSTCRFE